MAAKAVSGHSTPKSAMAMAIVATLVAPPLTMAKECKCTGCNEPQDHFTNEYMANVTYPDHKYNSC